MESVVGREIMRIFSRLSNWYFSKGALPYWGVLFLDCLIALFSGYVGSYLEHGGLEFAQHFWQLTAGNIVCMLLNNPKTTLPNMAMLPLRNTNWII